MKFLTFAFVLLLIGCGSSSDSNKPQATKNNKIAKKVTAKAKKPTPYPAAKSLKKVDRKLNYGLKYNNKALDMSSPIKVGKKDVVIDGWVVDVKKQNVPYAIYAQLLGKKIYQVRPKVKRADIAKKFKSSKYEESGFRLTIPNGDLKKGLNKVVFQFVTADKQEIIRANKVLSIIK